MGNLTDRAAYLRGWPRAWAWTRKRKSTRIDIRIDAGLMDEMAQKISDLDADVGELEEYVEDLDSDLSDMEEALFGDEDDECDCDDEDGCSCCDDQEELSFDCPHCGKTVLVKAADIDYDESPVCEYCGKPFFVDVEDDGKDE